mgnify:CR=1 FL=1
MPLYEHVFLARQDLSQAQVDALAAAATEIVESFKGKVVLVDFWDYTCINCLRTLPHVKEWHARYKDHGLVVIGMHTPEFAYERVKANLETAMRRFGVTYPVAQDNEYSTWDAWGNQYWPAKYLVDARGRVRFTHFGEGAYKVTEHAIHTKSGRVIPAENKVWCAGIRAPDFLKDLDGLETNRINQLVVDQHLRTTRDENVFAVLMDAVRVCSLGQITHALFEVGGQYRRSM